MADRPEPNPGQPSGGRGDWNFLLPTVEALDSVWQQRLDGGVGLWQQWDLATIPCRVNSFASVANQILTAGIDTLILFTAAGTEALIDSASQTVPRQRFLDCLSDMATIAVTPLVAKKLREHGVEPRLEIVSEAEQWKQVLVAMDESAPVVSQSVAIESTEHLLGLQSGLEIRGANVMVLEPFPKLIADQSLQLPSIEGLWARKFNAFLFLDADSAWRFMQVAKQFIPQPSQRLWNDLLQDHLVVAANPSIAEFLAAHGVGTDLVWEADKPNSVVDFGRRLETVRKQKRTIRMNLSGPATSPADPQAPWYNNPFMQACRGEPTDVTPIWMMRQAGRYMAEYREVRDKVSFLELCANPQLCSEVMCTAVSRLGVDAAIIFSDLLPILVPMGCDLEFVKGDGPVIHNPVRTVADIDRIKPLANNDALHFVMETVTQTRRDLPADMPLIGFSGAPFTLASYMIEGGSSRNYANTKKIMFGDHGAWKQLMEHLTESIKIYIHGQIEAGAQCIQLFDSWAGCLSYEDYRHFVLPYVQAIIASVPPSVPVINFATGNPALLPLLADTKASVIGIDWRVRLDMAWETVGLDRSVQGNLDPTVLLTDPQEIRKQAKTILDQANGRPGHIFNLGHGILPMTPVDNAIALVDAVHELSQQ